ncbi:MAG: hypothetical protein WD766_06210 [Gemmatimonadota bacterium]
MSTRAAGRMFALTLALAPAGLLSSAALSQAQAQAQAQAQVRPSEGYTSPRTEHGHPDLQGNWGTATITPLERPAGQGAVLSDEEVARLEGREAEFFQAGLQPSDPDRPAPPAGTSVGGYNRVYFDRGDRVAIVDGEPRSSLITNPADGQVPQLTPDGERRRQELRDLNARFGEYDNPENRPNGERCLVSFGSSAGPPMVPNNFYNNNYTIVQNEDHVLILTEMVHDYRIVRLWDGERLPDHMRPWFGDSWGRWEDDTLVVETTNLHPLQRWRGIPSDELRVVERFRRTDDSTIRYEFTIHDPAYGQPWGGEIPMVRLDDLLYEYACHEGNYALFNVLSGARAQERQARESQQR